MRHVFAGLGARLKNSAVYRVYNPKDELGRGRLCMLASGVMSGLVSQLSGGMFFVIFLESYSFSSIDIALINSLVSLPYLLNIFAPWILEHFRKRKAILVGARIVYYSLSIIGITMLPRLIPDQQSCLTAVIAVYLVANSINALTSSGFSAWHANFLPEDIRVDYFTSSSCVSSLITYPVTFGVSVLVDSVQGSPNELLYVTLLRFAAFALALIDCMILLVPKEYPYASAEKPRPIDIVRMPFRNRRFLLTILIAVSYTFALNLPNGTLDPYVHDIGVSTSLVNGINALYFLFFFFFTKMWKKFIAKHYWFRAFAFALLMQSVTYYAFSFVTANTIWLYVIVRFTQHIFGVVVNAIMASLPYVNLPEEGRTNFFAFYTILSNLTAAGSKLVGTAFAKWMGDAPLVLLGFPFAPTQILMFFCAFFQCAVALLSLALNKKVTPPAQLAIRNR